MSRGITQERAAKVARAHACTHCLEYSFKKITVTRAPASHQVDLKTAWVVMRTCGVCGLEQEMGLDATGDVIYGA